MRDRPNIWVINYNISLTWILRPFGDDFPNINHDFQGSVEQWGRYNLPWVMWPNYQRLPLPPEKKKCGHHQVMRRHQKHRRWNHDRNTVEICTVHPFSKVASFRNMSYSSFGFFWLDFNGWNHCFGSENLKNPRIALRLCHSQDLPSHHKCVGGWRQMHSWAICCCHFCAGDGMIWPPKTRNISARWSKMEASSTNVFNDPGTKV